MRKIFTFLLLALFSATTFADTWTVAGNNPDVFGISWDPTNIENDMKLVDGLYQFVKEDVTVGKGSIDFKVCKNHAWDEAYPSSDYKLNIAEDGKYDISITFNESSKEVTALATKKGEAVIEKHYLVVGEAAVVNGAAWNNDNADNLMVSTDDGATYRLSIENLELEKKDYEFKIVEKGTWTVYYDDGNGHNATFSIGEAAIYTIEYVFTVATSTCEVIATKTGSFVEPNFYIAGSMTDWDNDKIAVYDDSYTLSLAAGKHQLKVVDNGNWLGINAMSEVAGGLYRDQDGNVCFILDAAGDVTVTYKKGESPVFTLAGAFVAPEIKLIGINGWNEATDAIVFTAAPDGKSASKTLNLTGEWYDFKLIRAGEWLGKTNEGTENFRIHRGNNWVDALVRNYEGLKSVSLQPDKKGDYTFTYDFALGKLTVSFPELANSAVTIAAPAHGSISVLKGEEAVASGDKVEELTVLTVSLSDNTEGYIFSNLRAYLTDDPDSAIAIVDGKLTMPGAALTITADEAARKLANGFYLVGTFGGVNAWGIDDLTADKKFYVNPNNEEEYMLVIDLGIADEFKVFEVRDDAFVGYYPDGYDNNYIVDADHAGKNKSIYFDTDEHDGWHYGHIFVPDNATTAIDNTNVDANVMKRIENGQLIIIKNGVRYNVVGAELR